jgi:sugar phosphate isomerase/epimerase
MKLSCIPVTWFMDILEKRLSLSDWIARAAAFGLDGIDLAQAWIAGLNRREITDLGARAKDAGLEICMVRCAPDFTHPYPGHRRGEIDTMQKMIETAAVLGAPLVRITAGQAHPETERNEGIRLAAEGFRSIASAARGHGVTLIYENHTKASVWTFRDFSEDEEVFIRILEETRDSGIFANFDTANPLVHDREPLELLRRIGNRVRCVDANDTMVRGKFEFCVVGRGIVQFREIFTYLKHRLHFDSWISLEEASHTGEEGFHEATRFVRETWDDC